MQIVNSMGCLMWCCVGKLSTIRGYGAETVDKLSTTGVELLAKCIQRRGVLLTKCKQNVTGHRANC